jgi:hypothetical protein
MSKYRAQRYVRRQGTEIHADRRTRRRRTRQAETEAAFEEELGDVQLDDILEDLRIRDAVGGGHPVRESDSEDQERAPRRRTTPF